MRKIAAIVSLTILVTAGLSPARAGEAETIDAIVKAAAALDQAFEAQDTKATSGARRRGRRAAPHRG
jgi:hypothetical protein